MAGCSAPRHLHSVSSDKTQVPERPSSCSNAPRTGGVVHVLPEHWMVSVWEQLHLCSSSTGALQTFPTQTGSDIVACGTTCAGSRVREACYGQRGPEPEQTGSQKSCRSHGPRHDRRAGSDGSPRRAPNGLTPPLLPVRPDGYWVQSRRRVQLRTRADGHSYCFGLRGETVREETTGFAWSSCHHGCVLECDGQQTHLRSAAGD